MNSFFNLMLFFVWPMGGFLYNLVRPINRLTYIIFILFFFLIGCSFSFTDPSVDSYRYAEDFVKMSGSDLYSGFLYQIVFLGRIDFYYSLIALLLGAITNNPHFLYGIFGAIYGFLVCRLFVLLKRDWRSSFNIYVWILFMFMFILNPHSNINGVRFWTATWLYIVSLISYVIYGQKKWLIGILLTPFVHSSFIIYVCILFISYQFRNKYKLLYVICVIVFILNIVGIDTIILRVIPNDFSLFAHYQAYVNEEYMGEIAKEQAGKNIIHKMLPLYMNILYLFFVYKAIVGIEKIDRNTRFFLIVSMICCIFNILFSFIPSMARFDVILLTCFSYLLYKYYSCYRNYLYSMLILFLIPPLIIYIYDFYFIHVSVLNPIYITGSLLNVLNFSFQI